MLEVWRGVSKLHQVKTVLLAGLLSRRPSYCRQGEAAKQGQTKAPKSLNAAEARKESAAASNTGMRKVRHLLQGLPINQAKVLFVQVPPEFGRRISCWISKREGKDEIRTKKGRESQ